MGELLPLRCRMRDTGEMACRGFIINVLAE